MMFLSIIGDGLSIAPQTQRQSYLIAYLLPQLLKDVDEQDLLT